MPVSADSRWNPWRGLRGLPREVWVLSLATLVNKAGSMVLAFLALYLTRKLGYSVGTAANVLFLYGAGALVAAPVSGILSDKLGPIRIMRGSLLLSGLIMLVFPVAKSLSLVIALTLTMSVLAEAFRPANLTIFGDLVRPEQRKAGFALNRLAINLGMSVGPAVGGFLAAISFTWLFFVNGATSILAGLILVAAVFPLHRHHANGEQIEAAVSPLTHRQRGYQDPRLLFFLAGVLPVAIVLFQHLASMSVFLVGTLKLSEASYGALFTLNCLLIVFLEVPINIATAHWPHRRTLSLGALLFGIGFGALAFAWDFWSAAFTVVIWTFGEMFFFPGMAAYLTDIAPVSRRGEYMGLSQMVMGLAFMIGPWAGLLVLDRFGPKALWLSTFALGLGAAMLMSRLAEPRRAVEAPGLPIPTAAPSVEP